MGVGEAKSTVKFGCFVVGCVYGLFESKSKGWNVEHRPKGKALRRAGENCMDGVEKGACCVEHVLFRLIHYCKKVAVVINEGLLGQTVDSKQRRSGRYQSWQKLSLLFL